MNKMFILKAVASIGKKAARIGATLNHIRTEYSYMIAISGVLRSTPDRRSGAVFNIFRNGCDC